jgi:hypothetical protein
MSPRVQLVLYPEGDAPFANHAGLSLKIELPDTYSAEEIVAAVEDHLHKKYPVAIVRVESAADDGYDTRWHVYRDGLPRPT